MVVSFEGFTAPQGRILSIALSWLHLFLCAKVEIGTLLTRTVYRYHAVFGAKGLDTFPLVGEDVLPRSGGCWTLLTEVIVCVLL